MRRQFGIRLPGVGFALLFTFIMGAASAGADDFRPHGSIRLEYENEHDVKGDETVDTSTISQEYEIQFDGYIWRREFITFQTFFTYDDSMEDDSKQGDSRDRNIDFYEVTATFLPDWPAPFTVYAKKNLIILDSDQAADSETVEDTYRIEWLILLDKLPEMELEFERIEETTDESGGGGTTTDTRRDLYYFTASETLGGRTQILLEYQREEDSDFLQGTTDVHNTYIVTGTSELSTNLRIDARAEYHDTELETSTVFTSLAVREDVDSIIQVTFFDATSNNIGDHIAIPLTPSGALDFTDWVPSTFFTTVDSVNNNEITFTDPIPSDVMVVIEYETQDSAQYFDIYRGNDTVDTFSLTVTQVIITDGFDDFLVLSEYVTAAGGTVELDFSPLTDPEPISSTPFPLPDVDVTIVYNTRSRNHFEDDFPDVDIEQSGTSFDLSRVSAGGEEELLLKLEIGYLPTPDLDLNFRYEFDETEGRQETTTEHFVEASAQYSIMQRLINTTELSYERDATEFSFNPDVSEDDPESIEDTLTEEWNLLTDFAYTRLVGWGTLELDYSFEFETRDEESIRTTDTMTHTVGVDMLMGRTKITNELEYDRQEIDEQAPDEDSQSTEFTYEIEVANNQRIGGVSVSTTLEYEFEHDQKKDDETFTSSTYRIEEKLDYRALSFETSLEYEDEDRGDEWTKEWESDSELKYRPFRWLDLTSGLDWIHTANDEEKGTEIEFFIEADTHFKFGRTGTVEIGARQEWLSDDLGEDENTFELDAKAEYIYAEVRATLEVDFDMTEYAGESDDTEELTITVTLERTF